MSDTPSRTERLARLYGLLKDFLKPGNVVLAAMLIMIGVVAATGGWSKATQVAESEFPLIELDKDFTAGPFTLVFARAQHTATCPEHVFGGEHGCIVARLTATNTTDRLIEDSVFATHLLDSGMLEARDDGTKVATLLPHPSVNRVIDGLGQGAFQPGLATEVDVVWQLTKPLTSDDVDIIVKDAAKANSTLDGRSIYRLGSTLGRLPVEKG
ncbi:hypothetical protein BSZ39_03525 [Bowdeniella nasicola]|uniref:Uncharacterized protein n=1 Tax=Bowdeniella nasicola TaxID=208480 RepID=A0A1Q5Q3X7_9ACTO|nr:hypothetical protein [Bowdeniella nasicola]OKL54538.1 hypothetical protein BSZ39_03525 [Bowdeniella nasicola]